MTSDAKIGLLLGLVFIFIIAFVINGLPRFRGVTNNNELTTNMVHSQNGTPGIAAREHKALEVYSRTEQPEEQPLEKVQAPIEEKENFRYKIPLPGDISTVNDTLVEETAVEVEQVAQKPIISEKTQDKEQKPVEPVFPKVYVVSEGDNLADIAKMFYGDIEGNKQVSITRIFQANRNQLKSPDEIYVGQKLVVPSPTAKEEADPGFSSTLFEKVKSIGKKHLFNNNNGKTNQSKYYVVQEGDNLWRIAAKQLGDGSRYEEISKLNSDILENKDSLVVGMQLRMPAR